MLLYGNGMIFALFKKQADGFIRFKNSRRTREFLHLIIHDCEFLNNFKISDIDQLNLALIFIFGVILV